MNPSRDAKATPVSPATRYEEYLVQERKEASVPVLESKHMHILKAPVRAAIEERALKRILYNPGNLSLVVKGHFFSNQLTRTEEPNCETTYYDCEFVDSELFKSETAFSVVVNIEMLRKLVEVFADEDLGLTILSIEYIDLSCYSIHENIVVNYEFGGRD